MPTTDMPGVDFMVARQQLDRCRIVEASVPGPGELAPGQIVLRVDQFAFTANNITYAVFGDAMQYWNFFPAPEGWGRVPVWGFADVECSRHDAVDEGERVFGYVPMSTHVVLQPERVSAASFVDVSPHRKELPAVYGQYARTAADPVYTRATEDMQMLFRPLFMTSYLIDDFLADSGFFGARAVVISSASSKTAFGLAFLLHQNRPGQSEPRARCEIIGLTSPGNVPFVEGLGCYDRVLTYDAIASLPDTMPVVYVDIAGDGAVRSSVHHHFGDSVKHSSLVGASHWDRMGAPEQLPGAEPAFFFAPTQLEALRHKMGAQAMQERFAAAWRTFVACASDWITVTHGHGTDAIEAVYRETLAGRVAPDTAHVLTFDDAAR
jgi:hypothetical protein